MKALSILSGVGRQDRGMKNMPLVASESFTHYGCDHGTASVRLFSLVCLTTSGFRYC